MIFFSKNLKKILKKDFEKPLNFEPLNFEPLIYYTPNSQTPLHPLIPLIPLKKLLPFAFSRLPFFISLPT